MGTQSSYHSYVTLGTWLWRAGSAVCPTPCRLPHTCTDDRYEPKEAGNRCAGLCPGFGAGGSCCKLDMEIVCVETCSGHVAQASLNLNLSASIFVGWDSWCVLAPNFVSCISSVLKSLWGRSFFLCAQDLSLV